MANIKQYTIQAYANQDRRACLQKSASTTIVSQSLARAAVSSGTLAHYWYIATLAHPDIATRAHWDSGTLGLMYIGTFPLWHHLPCLHPTKKPRGHYLTKEDIFAFHVAIL